MSTNAGERGLWHSAKRHPVIFATILGCSALGIALGIAFLSEDWSLARRLLAGAVGGAGTGFLITATKMIG